MKLALGSCHHENSTNLSRYFYSTNAELYSTNAELYSTNVELDSIDVRSCSTDVEIIKFAGSEPEWAKFGFANRAQ